MIKQILCMACICLAVQPLMANMLVPRSVDSANADVYEILGVPTNATQTDIKQAFLAFTRTFRDNTHEGELTHYRTIQDAYSKVSTPRRRAVYDYRRNKGPRPVDVALESPASNSNFRAVFDHKPVYVEALAKTLAEDPSLVSALHKWFYLPRDFRTVLPRWLGVSKRGAYAVEMMIPAVFLAMSNSPLQTTIWSTTLGLFALFPNATVIKNYFFSGQPRPRALVKEYVESLESGTGPIVASLIAFDLVEPLLIEPSKSRLSAFAGEYSQLRIDRMAKTLPAIAKGQLLRFIQRDAKGLENPWSDLFEAEMRSRPKYWHARLAELQPLLLLSREGAELVDHAEELEIKLSGMSLGTAIGTRAVMQVKRTCEAALQVGAAFFSR